MQTVDFITALFCQVDDHLSDIPKHPEAHLWPMKSSPWDSSMRSARLYPFIAICVTIDRQ